MGGLEKLKVQYLSWDRGTALGLFTNTERRKPGPREGRQEVTADSERQKWTH